MITQLESIKNSFQPENQHQKQKLKDIQDQFINTYTSDISNRKTAYTLNSNFKQTHLSLPKTSSNREKYQAPKYSLSLKKESSPKKDIINNKKINSLTEKKLKNLDEISQNYINLEINDNINYNDVDLGRKSEKIKNDLNSQKQIMDSLIEQQQSTDNLYQISKQNILDDISQIGSEQVHEKIEPLLLPKKKNEQIKNLMKFQKYYYQKQYNKVPEGPQIFYQTAQNFEQNKQKQQEKEYNTLNGEINYEQFNLGRNLDFASKTFNKLQKKGVDNNKIINYLNQNQKLYEKFSTRTQSLKQRIEEIQDKKFKSASNYDEDQEFREQCLDALETVYKDCDEIKKQKIRYLSSLQKRQEKKWDPYQQNLSDSIMKKDQNYVKKWRYLQKEQIGLRSARIMDYYQPEEKNEYMPQILQNAQIKRQKCISSRDKFQTKFEQFANKSKYLQGNYKNSEVYKSENYAFSSHLNSFNVSPAKKWEISEKIKQEKDDKKIEMMRNIYFNKTYTNSFLDNPQIMKMRSQSYQNQLEKAQQLPETVHNWVQKQQEQKKRELLSQKENNNKFQVQQKYKNQNNEQNYQENQEKTNKIIIQQSWQQQSNRCLQDLEEKLKQEGIQSEIKQLNEQFKSKKTTNIQEHYREMDQLLKNKKREIKNLRSLTQDTYSSQAAKNQEKKSEQQNNNQQKKGNNGNNNKNDNNLNNYNKDKNTYSTNSNSNSQRKIFSLNSINENGQNYSVNEQNFQQNFKEDELEKISDCNESEDELENFQKIFENELIYDSYKNVKNQNGSNYDEESDDGDDYGINFKEIKEKILKNNQPLYKKNQLKQHLSQNFQKFKRGLSQEQYKEMQEVNKEFQKITYSQFKLEFVKQLEQSKNSVQNIIPTNGNVNNGKNEKDQIKNLNVENFTQADVTLKFLTSLPKKYRYENKNQFSYKNKEQQQREREEFLKSCIKLDTNPNKIQKIEALEKDQKYKQMQEEIVKEINHRLQKKKKKMSQYENDQINQDNQNNVKKSGFSAIQNQLKNIINKNNLQNALNNTNSNNQSKELVSSHRQKVNNLFNDNKQFNKVIEKTIRQFVHDVNENKIKKINNQQDNLGASPLNG